MEMPDPSRRTELQRSGPAAHPKFEGNYEPRGAEAARQAAREDQGRRVIRIICGTMASLIGTVLLLSGANVEQSGYILLAAVHVVVGAAAALGKRWGYRAALVWSVGSVIGGVFVFMARRTTLGLLEIVLWGLMIVGLRYAEPTFHE